MTSRGKIALRSMGKASTKKRWVSWFGIFVSLVLLALGAQWRVRDLHRKAMDDWNKELSSVADVSRVAIEQWLQERKSHAAEIARYVGRHPIIFSNRAKDLRERLQEMKGIERNLVSIQQRSRYAGIWVVDMAGRAVLAAPRGAVPDESNVKIALSSAPKGNEEIFGPRYEPDRSLRLAFMAPIESEESNSKSSQRPLLGAIIITTDPTKVLFPLVVRESIPTKTGEYMLVARNGDQGVILTPLRHPPTPALTVRIPWDKAPEGWKEALKNRDYFGAGKDFRGVPVLAVARHIAGPVALVRKIDQSEAFAPYNRQARTEGLLALMIVALVGLGLFAFQRSERAARLREVAASEAQLAGIVSSAMDAIIILNKDQRMSLFNAAAEEMFQWRPDEVVGQPLDLLIPNQFKAAHREHVKGFGESDQSARPMSSRGHLKGLRKNGEEFPVDAAIAQYEVDGQKKFSVMVRDITEQRKAEELLRKSEENYRRLFEESQDVVFISTADGKLVDINPAGVALFGYSSKEELLKADIARDLYFNPADRERDYRAHASTGCVKDFELALKRQDGSKVIVLETSVADRDAAGNIVAYRGTLRDVTERRALERQLLQAQKMEAVGQLAGGIAHDFNNILTAITGYSDLMLLSLPPSDPHRRNVDEISKAASRAASLTRQLLAFSRRQFMQPKVLDLNGVIADMDQMLRRLIGEHIELDISLAPDLVRVKADPGQIEQVLMNLAVNSRDAIPNGGNIAITTRNVVLDDDFVRDNVGAHPGPHALLSVRDTGHGMDADVLAHVFEPFFTTKEVGKETGLGLSTVYGIVKQSGGYITVQSEARNGAQFNVYLPATKEPCPRQDSAKRYSGLKQGSETILLVEDEEGVRTLGREVLEMHGYTVIAASNGEEAIPLSKQFQGTIHLMITDVVMPRMSGGELAQAMMSLRPNMRVLYVSGYSDEAVLPQNMLKSGASYLQKPFTPDALARKVRLVLEGIGQS